MAQARRIVFEAGISLVALGFLSAAIRADDLWVQLHFMRHYCVTESYALPLWHLARAVVVVVALVLVLRVRPRLGRWAEKHPVSETARAFGPALVAVVLAVPAADGILRFRNQRRARNQPTLVTSIEHRGRGTYAAQLRFADVVYHLNENGFRTASEDTVIDFAKPTILISGESLAFGTGLAYEDTVSGQLGADTGLQVANLGISGWPADSSMDRLAKWLPRFSRPIAVVFFVVHTWLEREVDPNRPRRAVGPDGNLFVKPPDGPEWLRTSPLLGVLKTAFPYHDASAIDVMRAIMKETSKAVRRQGAQPLFIVTQCGARCITPNGEPPWVAQRLLESDDALLVEFNPAEQLSGDMHPNRAGATVYANAIEKALREKGAVR
jgi:hypothetical protein